MNSILFFSDRCRGNLVDCDYPLLAHLIVGNTQKKVFSLGDYIQNKILNVIKRNKD